VVVAVRSTVAVLASTLLTMYYLVYQLLVRLDNDVNGALISTVNVFVMLELIVCLQDLQRSTPCAASYKDQAWLNTEGIEFPGSASCYTFSVQHGPKKETGRYRAECIGHRSG
jgi:hypothetical protein